MNRKKSLLQHKKGGGSVHIFSTAYEHIFVLLTILMF
jgi:hypothetical protein